MTTTNQKHQLSGRISFIAPEQQISEKFRKREIVIDTDKGQYSQLIKFEFVNDNISKLDAFRIGGLVQVSFNIRGRKSGDNYYVSLQGYAIQNG